MVQKDQLVDLSQSESEQCPAGPDVGAVDVQNPVGEHSAVTGRTGRRKFISGVVEGKKKTFNIFKMTG